MVGFIAFDNFSSRKNREKQVKWQQLPDIRPVLRCCFLPRKAMKPIPCSRSGPVGTEDLCSSAEYRQDMGHKAGAGASNRSGGLDNFPL